LTGDQVTRLLAAAYEDADAHRRRVHANRGQAELLRGSARGYREQGKPERAAQQDERAEGRDRASANDDRLYALSYTYFALWQLLFSTGIRPSEALALKWTDIRDGRLYVERFKDKKGRIGAPKSRRSRRDFALHSPTPNALETHQAKQRARIEARRAAGKS
jgi:integrase